MPNEELFAERPERTDIPILQKEDGGDEVPRLRKRIIG